jgi:hypothetical protein
MYKIIAEECNNLCRFSTNNHLNEVYIGHVRLLKILPDILFSLSTSLPNLQVPTAIIFKENTG